MKRRTLAKMLTLSVAATLLHPITIPATPITSRAGEKTTIKAQRRQAAFSALSQTTQTPNPTFKLDYFQGAKGSSDNVVVVETSNCANFKFKPTNEVIKPDEIKRLEEKEGLKITGVNVGTDGCRLEFRVAVLESSTFGRHNINLQPQSGNSQSITFDVIQAPAIPPKPIPPGMNPQVDIMWAVVPQSIVKDNFGQRVGKLFYCIEVVIGNNTGYDLQIASVGFKLGPVGKAATTMAKTYKSVAEQVSKAQDKSFEASFNEIDKACNPETHSEFNDTAKYVECVNRETAEAIKRITARQAPLVAAVQQQKSMLTQLSQQMYGQKLPVSSYTMARGSVEHGQFWSLRNLGVNGLRALGPVLTGFTPYFHALNRQRNFAEAINIISNPIEKGFELVVPDETVDQMQRLDEQILRDGIIISNNRQVRTRAFIPKDLLRLDKDIRDDPMIVTQSLGELHLIGDVIQYINRVSVSSGGSGEVTPPPTIDPKSYDSEFELNEGESETITLTGTSLADAVITSDDPNIKVTKTTNTSTSLSATVEIKDITKLGQHVLNVTNARSTVPIPITVKQPLPSIIPESFQPNLKTEDDKPVELKSFPDADTPYRKIKLTGRFLQGAKLTSIGDNPMRATDIEVAPDGKSLTMTIIVPTGTKASDNYKFQVHNQEHQTTDVKQQITVKVLKRAAPTLASADAVRYGENGAGNPPTENPNKDVDATVIIAGKNLKGTRIEVPDGSNLKADIKSQTDEKITAVITVPKGKSAKEYTLHIVDEEKQKVPFPFKVNEQPAVKIDAPTALSIKAGEEKVLVLKGQNLEGAEVSETLAGWTITKDAAGSTGTQLTLKVTAPAGLSGNPTLTFKVGNLRPAVSVSVPTTQQ